MDREAEVMRLLDPSFAGFKAEWLAAVEKARSVYQDVIDSAGDASYRTGGVDVSGLWAGRLSNLASPMFDPFGPECLPELAGPSSNVLGPLDVQVRSLDEMVAVVEATGHDCFEAGRDDRFLNVNCVPPIGPEGFDGVQVSLAARADDQTVTAAIVSDPQGPDAHPAELRGMSRLLASALFAPHSAEVVNAQTISPSSTSPLEWLDRANGSIYIQSYDGRWFVDLDHTSMPGGGIPGDEPVIITP